MQLPYGRLGRGIHREGVEHDGCRCRDVQRVDAVRHGDRHDAIGGVEGVGAEPVALRTEDERESLGRIGGEVAERDRAVGEGEGGDREVVGVQHPCRLGPLGQPGPRHLEHRAHAHAHAAPVERVGAPRADEHRIGAERRDRAEDGTDVGMVHDVLEHDDPPGFRQQCGGVAQRRPFEGRECPAVHAIAGDRLELLGVGEMHRDVELGERGLEPRKPLLLHEHGTRPMACADGAADDLGGFGDVEPVRRLVRTAQGHVGEPCVVGHGVGCRVADSFDVHGSPPLKSASARNIPENGHV